MINRRKSRGQAMVEFALALPVFLFILYGLIEASRLIFIATTVSNSSREAVRYASAWGFNSAGVAQYRDCAGIRAAAKRVGFLLNLQNSNISIRYDHGSSASEFSTTCPPVEAVSKGDRVRVIVSYTYRPILANFLPFTVINFNPPLIALGDARTIMGVVDMGN